MKLSGRRLLIKLKNRNRGNIKLSKAIDELVETIEIATWRNPPEVKHNRPDADCVHSDGFYFFNIRIHRTLVLLEFDEDDATIVWVGSHDEYDRTFRGNKKTIEKWLRNNGLIA